MKLGCEFMENVQISGDADSEGEGATDHLLLNVSDERAFTKISVRDLHRWTNDGAAILKGVSVDIKEGSIVGVIGPSGSGKSTFLRALNRLWEPPVGSVFIDGIDITNLNVLSLRRRVGMLFQTPVLFQGTVGDNVRYGPRLRGKNLRDDEVAKFLSLADLDPSFCSRSVNDLSVGQAQRVALARTMANDPEVLLLDEPTSALDPLSAQNIEDSIAKLGGMTIVMVSHSVKQIQRLAHVVCLMVNGEIVEVIKCDELSRATHPIARKFLELSS